MSIALPHETGFFSHTDCRLHDMGGDHPESPARLDAIADRVLAKGLTGAMTFLDAPLLDPQLLTLAHAPDYVSRLTQTAEQLAARALDDAEATVSLDPDTTMNAHSWQAALRAAGAGVAAVDAVIDGQLQNAFCSIRPPGHHATRAAAMGFCLVSNVALAAKYAVEKRGLKRVAIVDFDVHHGNGTEDIVAGDERILMVGFYQHPFYPNTPLTGAANVHNSPVAAYTVGDAIREIVTDEWLPRLHAFKPELVLISAGFDAHRLDDLGQMGLVEADYAWMTSQLMAIADQYAQRRLVSCLEGGYNLQALATSVEAHLRVLAGLDA
jgi:acetoin utilization deacetylase AcuC-like enzyme